MPESLTVKHLLGELVGIPSHLPHPPLDKARDAYRNQVAMASFIADVATQLELGDVQVVPYPGTAAYADRDPRPCNVIIDVEGKGRAHKEELVVFHGHFDTITPPDGYRKHDVNPYHLRQDPTDMNICSGLGSYDMLSGVTAILLALRNIRIASHRRIRAVLVSGEENESEGTHAALHRDRNLFQYGDLQATSVLSTEIAVATNMTDAGLLVVGRPGRVGFTVKVKGEAKHVGRAMVEDRNEDMDERFSKASNAVKSLRFTSHPNDTQHLLENTRPITGKFGSNDPEGLSTPDEVQFRVEVQYMDPEQNPTTIEKALRDAIREALGDDDFSIQLESGRQTPFTRPWMESLDSPLIFHGLRYGNQTIMESAPKYLFQENKARLCMGRGVADENIVRTRGSVQQILCIPPAGRREHHYLECVDIRSIQAWQIPMLQKLAGHEGLLTVAPK